MALDIVLRGAAGSVRLAAILSSIHGDNIAKLVSSAPDAESRVRGADQWTAQMEALSAERRATLESFSGATFELPLETLAAGMLNLLFLVLHHADKKYVILWGERKQFFYSLLPLFASELYFLSNCEFVILMLAYIF
jgi:hypothetical protein